MEKLFMKSLFYLCVSCMAILMPFGLTSCAADDELAEYKEYDGGGIKSFTSFTATLDEVAGTRAYLDAEATNGIRRVHWEEGDVISVYSDINPTLKKFVLTGIDENGIGTFTGEKITGNYFYAVFAPGKEITVDASDPDVVHLKGAVFNQNMMADQGTAANFTAPMVAATTGSSFPFKQTTGLVKITVGNVHQVDDLFFRGSKLEPIGEDYLVDMSEDKPVLKLDERANIVSHDQIITDLDYKFVDVYFTLPPMVFENGFLLTITGVDAQGKEFEIDKSYNSRFEVKAGCISSFSLVDVSAELEAQGSDEIIVFADPEVKQICVENWDTNGDGELSYKEAAAVTEIGQIFRYNYEINSFNELQFFTGIMSIGYETFYFCRRLTSIVIPGGVTSIGEWAFYNCSSLTSIVIPEGVTSIGSSAFGCSSLASIVIPEGVTSIGDNAFYGCGLTSIVIPEGVTSIGNGAFAGEGCWLTSVKVDKNNPYYDSRNDCNAIIETESNTLVAGCAFTVIPSSVTSIGDNAFSGCGLTSIVIPEGVTSIGDYAFGSCYLTSIVIPEGVTSIARGAFFNCSSLTSIVIPEGVTSIGDYAFYGCSSLTSIVIPEGVASIDQGAFYNCYSLTNIEIPNSITTIGFSSLNVTSVGCSPFYGCSNLTSFTCLATKPPTLGGYGFFME